MLYRPSLRKRAGINLPARGIKQHEKLKNT